MVVVTYSAACSLKVRHVRLGKMVFCRLLVLLNVTKDIRAHEKADPRVVPKQIVG